MAPSLVDAERRILFRLGTPEEIPVQASPDSDFITPRAFLRRIFQVLRRSRRFWPALVVAASLGIAAGAFVPRILPPVYQSETVLTFKEIVQTHSLLGTRQTRMETRRQRNARLREMVLSRSNLESIISEFSLYPSTVEKHSIVDAVEDMRHDTRCRVGEADSFAIKFQGDEPELVHQVTKRLADSLIEQTANYSAERATSTQKFLETQLDTTTADLQSQEEQLAIFLAAHPEFALDDRATGAGAAGASIRAAEQRARTTPQSGLEMLESQAARLRRQLRARSVSGGSPVTAPTASLSAEDQRRVNVATRQLERARENLNQKQARYTDRHPDVTRGQAEVKSATAKLATTRAQAKAVVVTASGATSDLQAEQTLLRHRLAAVEAAVVRAKKAGDAEEALSETRAASIVSLETEWTGLNREVAAVRERHEEVRWRLFQASIVARVESVGGGSQMVIIDPAYVPQRPIKRGTKRVAAAAFILVSMLGGLLALGLALLDDRVYDEDDLRRLNIGTLCHSVPVASDDSRLSGVAS